MGFDFGKIHVANSVTLSTRVRTDIMRGIAVQFTVEGRVSMFVAAYSSRPVIHIKDSNTGSSYALTFADAVSRYGTNLKEDFLIEAYRKCGVAFKGQLEQHFVVLKDCETARVSAKDLPNSCQRSARQSNTNRGRPQFQRLNPRHTYSPQQLRGNKRPFDQNLQQSGGKRNVPGSRQPAGPGSGSGSGTIAAPGPGFSFGNALAPQLATGPFLPTSFNFAPPPQLTNTYSQVNRVDHNSQNLNPTFGVSTTQQLHSQPQPHFQVTPFSQSQSSNQLYSTYPATNPNLIPNSNAVIDPNAILSTLSNWH